MIVQDFFFIYLHNYIHMEKTYKQKKKTDCDLIFLTQYSLVSVEFQEEMFWPFILMM